MFRMIFFMTLLTVNLVAAGTTYELALNWKAEPEFGGFYAAIDLLKKRGIELRILEGGSGTPTTQMLASKQVPLAIVSGDELIIARERGMDLVAIFAVYQTNPQGIMVRADSPWKTFEELLSSADATIAVQMGLPYVSFIKKKYPNFKAKFVPYLGGVGPFLSQKNYTQQCFVTAEPLSAQKAGVPTRTFTLDEIGFNPYLAVVAVHRDRLKDKATLSTLVKAFQQGWENYLKNPAKIDQQMNKLNPSMSLQTFADAGKAQLRLVKPKPDFIVGSMTEDRWKTLSLQLQELGLIKTVQEPQSYFQLF